MMSTKTQAQSPRTIQPSFIQDLLSKMKTSMGNAQKSTNDAFSKIMQRSTDSYESSNQQVLPLSSPTQDKTANSKHITATYSPCVYTEVQTSGKETNESPPLDYNGEIFEESETGLISNEPPPTPRSFVDREHVVGEKTWEEPETGSMCSTRSAERPPTTPGASMEREGVIEETTIKEPDTGSMPLTSSADRQPANPGASVEPEEFIPDTTTNKCPDLGIQEEFVEETPYSSPIKGGSGKDLANNILLDNVCVLPSVSGSGEYTVQTAMIGTEEQLQPIPLSNTRTLFHGTSFINARQIQLKDKFVASDSGFMGKGVYCSSSFEGATAYTSGIYGGVVLKIIVSSSTVCTQHNTPDLCKCLVVSDDGLEFCVKDINTISIQAVLVPESTRLEDTLYRIQDGKIYLRLNALPSVTTQPSLPTENVIDHELPDELPPHRHAPNAHPQFGYKEIVMPDLRGVPLPRSCIDKVIDDMYGPTVTRRQLLQEATEDLSVVSVYSKIYTHRNDSTETI